MKLVYSPPSPFVRKVTTLIHHAGLDDRIELVNVKTTALSVAEEARAANPLGKIPVMILDDGKALFDSRVITRFLDDLAGSNLYPQESMYEADSICSLSYFCQHEIFTFKSNYAYLNLYNKAILFYFPIFSLFTLALSFFKK